MKDKINYKAMAVQAGITALAFALVNRIMTPKKGLGSIALKGLAFLPLEHQAKFADAVTVENARDPKWLTEQFGNINPDDSSMYGNMNQTSIGNSAYVALYGVLPEARTKALKVLENIKRI